MLAYTQHSAYICSLSQFLPQLPTAEGWAGKKSFVSISPACSSCHEILFLFSLCLFWRIEFCYIKPQSSPWDDLSDRINITPVIIYSFGLWGDQHDIIYIIYNIYNIDWTINISIYLVRLGKSWSFTTRNFSNLCATLGRMITCTLYYGCTFG